MTPKEYTLLCLFCGLGGGGLGFKNAHARLFGTDATFRLLGGIDNDPGACEDWEYLTKSPALCADLATMTPGALREFVGPVAPDVVFDSAPCKADSGLTNRVLAKTAKYVDMAELYVTGVELLLTTWDVPPKLVLKENVSRILSNGADRVARVTKMMEEAGYAVHISTHDCGELGGLAQHRRRALMVCRLKSKVTCYLYQPPKRRVRACGEVLGELPLPETPSAGPMHKMPRIGWMTWLRLAMIPPSGDHRDLPGVLAEHQARSAVWARQHVEAWGDPSVTVTTSGTNGAYGVADPRVGDEPLVVDRLNGAFRVEDWADPSHTIVGPHGTGGNPHVADPRVGVPACSFGSAFGVKAWGEPGATATGHGGPGGGAFTVADPRVVGSDDWHPGAFGVKGFADAAGTVTGHGHPSGGAFAVADPRVVEDGRFNGAHGVRDWDKPATTVTQGGATGGRFSVADPRVVVPDNSFHAYGVTDLGEAAGTVTCHGRPGGGAFAVADSRVVPQAGNENAHWNKHPVTPWEGPAGTVATATRPGSGAPCVADPRAIGANPTDGRFSSLGVMPWDAASGTITSGARPSRGRFAVADGRLVGAGGEPEPVEIGKGAYGRKDQPGDRFRGSLGVVRWDAPVGVVSSAGNPAKGPFSVADVRMHRTPGRNPDHCMYVLPWSAPSFTVHGQANPGTGAYTVADGREEAQAFGFLSLDEAMGTINAEGCVEPGPWAIVDTEGDTLAFIHGAKRSPFVLIEEPAKTKRGKPKLRRVDVPVVILVDGLWKRPMTPLELARLQDLPAFVDGKPLKLSGENVGAWVERIGNAVPVGTAKAIAEQMLLTLLSSEIGAGMAPSGGLVWVTPEASALEAGAP
jgi:site-specific DNA-cytosine methylase